MAGNKLAAKWQQLRSILPEWNRPPAGKQHETLFGIARAIAGLSLGSLVLGAIPFFFWDLTERKHNKMMEILAVRARLADGEIDEEEAAVQEREMKGDEML